MDKEKDTNINKIDFTFGWLALKLLGKSLYSNAWSAISELVANGFDANAQNVYVYINNIDKANSTIELFDDGDGMDETAMQTYVRVGFNKREVKISKSDNYLPMGRKGIGKLAALYLSENYYLLSKTDHSNLKWQMMYRENADDEQEHPFLSQTDEEIKIICNAQWNDCKTGTMIRMNNVNLCGLGDVAVDALSRKLSNFFALDSMNKRQIHLCVVSKYSDPIKFEPVKKEIAFNNMAFLDYEKDSVSSLKQTIENCAKNIIEFPYTKLNGNQTYKHSVETEDFNSIENINISDKIKCINLKGEEVEKEYKLTGWVGLHSTIEEKLAEKNDPLFTRNKFYNPIQLRLYVRNKLAMENFLTVINNTQAFVNYIEGEIHFDILDEDDLPDIATSNRQGLDEHDVRVQKLAEIVKKIVNNLISKRTDLANKIKKEQEELLRKQEDNAKKQFVKEIETEVDSFSNLSNNQKDTLTTLVSNKIKGDVTPKSDYIVFISHSSEDKIITNFIYHLLKAKGANDKEFFYTSRDDSVEQYNDVNSLATQIKNNILKDNVLLLYLTSSAYKASEFCMFEGGAGWATRSVGEYISLALTYPEMPQFITNGKLEFTFENNRNLPLDRKTYLFLIEMFNRIIEHLNAGRRANGELEMQFFDEPNIPTDIELNRKGEDITKYMDDDILEHWKYYITDNVSDYMEKRYPKKTVEELQLEIAKLQKELEAIS